MEAGVQEPTLGVERGTVRSPIVTSSVPAKSTPVLDRQPERSRRERAVEVDLHPVGADQAHALAEPPVEAGAGLGRSAPGAAAAQQRPTAAS